MLCVKSDGLLGILTLDNHPPTPHLNRVTMPVAHRSGQKGYYYHELPRYERRNCKA